MLSLLQLRTFHTVVEVGTYGGAVRRLNYSPSAVSLHLSRLEAALGGPLLQRVGHRHVPTARGKEAFEATCIILAAHDRLLAGNRDRARSS